MAKAIRRKRIYIFKKLFLPKDYILVFSMYVFGGVLILLQDIQWWYSITLASCAAFVVSFVIIRWFL
ncbi:hypothetical protein GW750_08760 [bacterium]|nr:hypothetical protein [bacterium]